MTSLMKSGLPEHFLKNRAKVIIIGLGLFAFAPRVQSQSIRDTIVTRATSDPVGADSLAMANLIRAQQSESDTMIMRAHYLAGLSKYYLGQYYLSTDFYRKALANPVAEQEALLREACWNNIGINYDLQGNYPGSLEAYRQSLQVAEARGDSLSIAQSWINIGLLENRTGRPDHGLDLLDRAEAFFTGQDDTFHLALVAQNKAAIYESLGSWNDVYVYSERAARGFEGIGYPFRELTARSNMGLALIRLGKYDQALPLISGILDRSRSLNSDPNIATALSMLGTYYLAVGQWEQAYAAFDSSLTISKRVGIANKLDWLYFSMLEAASYSGKQRLLNSVLERYRDFRENYLSARIAERYSELSTQYELDDRIREIQQQRDQIREKKQRILTLTVFSLVLLGALLIVLFQYYGKLRLTRALYRKNKDLLARTAFTPPVKHPDFDQSQEDKKKERLEKLFKKLDATMVADKLYLDSSLSIGELSKLLAVNEVYVSQAINLYGGGNFNQYVNTFRVEEAQRLIQDNPKNLELKMLTYQCGFNSYSTFLRLFKEHTGLTPSSYFKQVESDFKNQYH